MLEDSQPVNNRDGNCPLEAATTQILLEVNRRDKFQCSSSAEKIPWPAECSGNRRARAGSILTGVGVSREGCRRGSNRRGDANHRARGEARAIPTGGD